MKNLINKIDKIRLSIEGINDDRYKSIFNGIVSVLDTMADELEQMTIKQEYLEENVQYMDEDLTDLQEELFEEVTFDELNNIEDEYVEIKCEHCDKPLFVEKAMIDESNKIPCPFCNENAK